MSKTNLLVLVLTLAAFKLLQAASTQELECFVPGECRFDLSLTVVLIPIVLGWTIPT